MGSPDKLKAANSPENARLMSNMWLADLGTGVGKQKRRAVRRAVGISWGG